MKIRILAGLCVILAIAGCDQRLWVEKFAPKAESEFAQHYIALFQARDFGKIEEKIDPSLRKPQLRSKLEQIAALVPVDKPKNIKVVWSQTWSHRGATQTSLTLEYEYPHEWLVANVLMERGGGQTLVKGIHVQPLSESLEKTNRFTFQGKSVIQLIVFALAIGVPLLVVVATVLCIKTPVPKRKWLWIVFILLGVGQATLNWSDGNLSVNVLSVQLLGAGFWKASPYAPLLLSVSVPLGAIIFLFKRKKWLIQNAG